MPLPSDHWQRALALMDTAVTLRPDERDAWLESMAATEPQVAPLLRKLLSAHRRVETNDILATLPRQQRAPGTANAGQTGAHIGPFELTELLGHGGMGSVWRARYADGRMKRDVAVKLPATSDNPAALASLRERFARERDFLAQLEHPNIARLYDTGISDEGQPYLAMEYVAGEPIDSYCDTHRLSIKARLTLYLQVLDAVEFAHRQLVLHRDLKPGNVLVDASGQVRLLDFGVAKLLPQQTEGVAAANTPAAASAGTDLTEMAGAAITLAYAAPEQINNGRLSTATDVYALGVMLYRLLTGSAPYQPKRDTRGALEDEVLTVVPTYASARFATLEALDARQSTEVALRRTLAGDIDTILAKALKKDPQERYPTVAALAEDLRRHHALQPINARPDGLWYRTERFVARHQAAVGASALALSVLFITTGVAVWQAQVATASAARATKESARLTTAQKFLAGIFASADPEQTKGASITAREILDRGRDTVEKELANDPEALALVLAQIGDIYFRLGLPDQYLAVQRRRVAVLDAQPNSDVNAVVDAKLALGQALGDSSVATDRAEAMPTLTSAHVLATTRNASTDRIVWALCLLSDQHRVEKRLPESAVLAGKAVDLAERTGPNPGQTLAKAYLSYAVVARDMGRIDEARAFYLKTLAIDATGKGRGHIDQALTLSSLAQLEYEAGDYLASMQQALAVVEMARDHLGDVKFNLAPARRIAVLAAERAGDLPLAQRYAAELLQPEIASDQPMRAAAAHQVLGRVAMSANDLERADAEFKLAAPVLDANFFWSGRLDALRAELALRDDEPQDAFDLMSKRLEKQVRQYGASNPELAPTLEWLAVAEARLGSVVAARDHIGQSCQIRSVTRAADHPLRVRCEGYQVLLSGDLSTQAKSATLRKLADTLAQGRADKVALLPSLRTARLALEASASSSFTSTQFPILD